MNKGYYLKFIFLSLVFISCSKKLTSTDSLVKEENLQIKQLDFEYFSAKSKIKYHDLDNNFKATANIRIKKDSVIWLSLTATLGIEALRVMITQDSIAIIDRVKKEYMRYDFEELSKKLNFKFDFQTIQAMILGNLPQPLQGQELVEKNEFHFIVKQNSGAISIENYINRSNLKLEKVFMQDNPTKNTLVSIYGNFQKLSQFDFPYTNLLTVNYLKNGSRIKTTIDINYNKAEIVDGKIKFPFNIPQKYARK